MQLTKDDVEKRIKDSYELTNNVLNAVPDPMVTVRTITYQHGPYIKDCIEGVLMQKTTFPVEFIIGEDFSTDGTREIVFEYARKYPDKIRVLIADYNVGAKINSHRCRIASRGKYVAICEGDDYWIDPYKLQKQVDFLENNPECSGCFHASRIDIQNSFRKKTTRYKGPQKFDLKYYLKQNIFITTASLVFKKNIDTRIPEWKHNIFAGDFVLRYFILIEGSMGYIDEIMSVYNKGVPGSWSKQKLTHKKIAKEYFDNLYVLSQVDLITNYQYNWEVMIKVKSLYERYVCRYISISNFRKGIKVFLMNLSVFNVSSYKLLLKTFYSRIVKK